MNDKQTSGSSDGRIEIGISSCLLGKKVRYDGAHRHDRYLTDVLEPFVAFVPICPEVKVGMDVPREKVCLEGDPNQPRMVAVESGIDCTDRMNSFSVRWLRQKQCDSLSGFILKSRSPSCGIDKVKILIGPGSVRRKGTGLFAAALMRHYPDLPVEDEDRLGSPVLRENFVERVFAYSRLQKLFAQPYARGRMVEFHTAQKYLLLAHSPEYYRKLGRLVARIKQTNPGQFKDKYQSLFMRALKFKATVKKHTNVLQHIAGYLKKELSGSEKRDVLEAIADYHKSLVPLIVPITLLRHFANKYENEYIQNQYYLKPHPKEVMLRNHV